MCPDKKIRNTAQRRVILEALQKSESHPTAGELYKIVKRRLVDISLGTVYRNLVLLSDMGIIQKLDLGGSEARFDGRPEQHYHVQCIECGRVNNLPDLPIEQSIKKFKGTDDFKITSHLLVFYGVCSQCQKKEMEK